MLSAGWRMLVGFRSEVFRGCAGGEFAEDGEESRCRIGVLHGVESDGSGEVWRVGAEMDLQEAVLAGGHQGIHNGRQFLGPFSARGENDRTGAVEFPVFRGEFVSAVALSAPAMV